MLRYFAAGHFWLFVTVCLLLGCGYARTSPNYYTMFGVGWIEPWTYHLTVIVAFTAAAGCFWGWWTSRHPQAKPALAFRRDELAA